MLTEERKKMILQKVDQTGGVSVQELMVMLNASESTIRRDLNELDRKGLLVKVHGGAMPVSKNVTLESTVSERSALNRESKKKIAAFAASMITDEDVVYLDAGTTTALLVDELTVTRTIFVTNAIEHARRLCSRGFQVYMPGGWLKAKTEAMLGAQTCEYLSKFHFTKGFFGADGVNIKYGYTTPDPQEAEVKAMAVKQTKEKILLCDSSKVDKIYSVTFADFEECTLITDAGIPMIYQKLDRVLVAE